MVYHGTLRHEGLHRGTLQHRLSVMFLYIVRLPGVIFTIVSFFDKPIGRDPQKKRFSGIDISGGTLWEGLFGRGPPGGILQEGSSGM